MSREVDLFHLQGFESELQFLAQKMIDISQILRTLRVIGAKFNGVGREKSDQNITQSVFIAKLNSSRREIICIKCKVEVNAYKRRKLFQTGSQYQKTQACVNVERIVCNSLSGELFDKHYVCIVWRQKFNFGEESVLRERERFNSV